ARVWDHKWTFSSPHWHLPLSLMRVPCTGSGIIPPYEQRSGPDPYTSTAGGAQTRRDPPCRCPRLQPLAGRGRAGHTGYLNPLPCHDAHLVQQLGGRAVGSRGDSLLAEFPSVVAAVQCAVAMQQELKARNAALSVECRSSDSGTGIGSGAKGLASRR